MLMPPVPSFKLGNAHSKFFLIVIHQPQESQSLVKVVVTVAIEEFITLVG